MHYNASMKTYLDIQVFSVGILLFFSLPILFRLWSFRSQKTAVRYLKRYKRIKKLKKLDWDAFEHLCKLLFEAKGWKVLENEKKGADGGVDLWMKKRGKEAIVQCKKYEDARVGIKVIREMYGLIYEYGVKEAYVVTTSEFTKECYRFVEDKPITLINGDGLVRRIKAL